MNPLRRYGIAAAALLTALTAEAAPSAHIGYLYPAGGQAGKVVEVVVGGRALWGINSASVSGGGVKVESYSNLPGIPHIGGTQKSYIRKYLEAIERGDAEPPPLPSEEVRRNWSKSRALEKLAELTPLQRSLIAHKIFVRRDPLQTSPSIAQIGIIRIRIYPHAAPGRRELRLVGRARTSDPLPFYIDTVPELCEPRFTLPGKPKPRMRFTVPAVLNGQILPGETDVFLFSARRGEVVTFAVRGRALVPFLGDGVPGHFQPVLEVFDANDRRVASADDRFFDPDPTLVFRAPRDGEYSLRIRDALHRGREDFVYRIRASRGEVKRAVPRPHRRIDGEWKRVANGSGIALPAHLRFDIGKPGARLSWTFQAKAGEKFDFEVMARRIGSPLDARMLLRDSAGATLAENDDRKLPRIGTTLHQADPGFTVTIPADGVYTVEVADTSGTGCPEAFGYLSIEKSEPDFDLYVCPSAISCAAYAPQPVHVLAVRRGGFDGRIVLGILPDSPFQIVGENSLAPGMDRALFTVASTSNANADNRLRPIRLVGMSGGLRREARAADEAMQAFAYTHLVPAEKFMGVVAWNPPNGEIFRRVDPFSSVTVAPGSSAELRLWQIRPLPKGGKPVFSLIDPPAGVDLGGVEEADGMFTLNIRARADAPECRANCAVRVNSSFVNRKGKRDKTSFVLPAFRIEVKK